MPQGSSRRSGSFRINHDGFPLLDQVDGSIKPLTIESGQSNGNPPQPLTYLP